MSDHALKKLANRTNPFQESIIREMTRVGEETGAINLSQGLPDYDTPERVLTSAIGAVYSGHNQYSFPFGDERFRHAIAQKSARDNQITADPLREITVTCGVSEAIMAAFFALTDPGDEAILFEPWYENYLPACYLSGVTPRFVPMRLPGFGIDLDEVEQAVNSKTRLMVINTPHNPTGRVFTMEELTGLAEICQQHGLIAITDEIYEYILYDGRKHISPGSLAGMEDRTVTISGLGKTFAVTGWRVGWAIAPAPLTQLIRKVHDYLTICAPTPLQIAGTTALNSTESTFYTKMSAEYQHRRETLLEGLTKGGFHYRTPEGDYYVMADFSTIPWPSEKYQQADWSIDRRFAEFLAREVGVAVVPGSSFYINPTENLSLIRINFAQSPANIKRAAAKLAALSN